MTATGPELEFKPIEASKYQDVSTFVDMVKDILEDVDLALQDESKAQLFLDSANMIYGQNAHIYKHIFDDQLNLRRERLATEKAAQALASVELTNIYKDSSLNQTPANTGNKEIGKAKESQTKTSHPGKHEELQTTPLAKGVPIGVVNKTVDNTSSAVMLNQPAAPTLPRLYSAKIKPSAQSTAPILPSLVVQSNKAQASSLIKAPTPGSIKQPAKKIPPALEKTSARKAILSKKVNDKPLTIPQIPNKPSKTTFNETVKSIKESMAKLLKKNERLEEKVELLTDEIKYLTKQQKKARKESDKKSKSYTPALNGQKSKAVAPTTTTHTTQASNTIEKAHTRPEPLGKQKETPTKLSEKEKMLQALAKIKSLATPK